MGQIANHIVWKGVLEQGSMWAYADQGSFKMTLRRVKNNYTEVKSLAEDLQPIVAEKFSEEKLYAEFCSNFYSKEEEELASEINNLFAELND